MSKLLLFLALSIGFTTNASAIPSKVVIIRHANRLIPNGQCLSLSGLERAESLAIYFSHSPEYSSNPISHIFAAYSGEPRPYLRCRQTAEPIATRLQIPLNINYNNEIGNKLVHDILTQEKYDKAIILICWNHLSIPELLKEFGVDNPGLWAKDVFDQMYIITFDKDGKPSVETHLQKLMFGDRQSLDDKPSSLPEINMPCPRY